MDKMEESAYNSRQDRRFECKGCNRKCVLEVMIEKIDNDFDEPEICPSGIMGYQPGWEEI